MFRISSQIFVLWSILLLNQLVLSPVLIDQDQAVLLDFANALEPLPNGWNRINASEACTSWSGVTCYTGAPIIAVSSLRLTDFGLVGTIPTSIGNFKAILSIFLSKNNLYGTIPDSLGNLSLIQVIDFSDNILNGTIPSSIGGLNKTLSQLLIPRNKLSGPIPAAIGNLKKLTYLQLYGNLMNGNIPDELTSVAGLQTLDLSRNYLSGSIPIALNNFVNMTDLSLALNQLTGPIPSISQMTRLKTMFLYSNLLSGPIPEDIGTLTELTKIQIGTNGLSGTIPASIGNLTQLTILSIQSCKLTGSIPSEVSRLTKLATFSLNSNSLNGTIPSLELMTGLKDMCVENTADQGSISNYFNSNLNANSFSGALPNLSSLVSLATLRVSANQLSGSIPNEIGTLKILKELTLDNNNFNGTIPESLGALSSLTLLQLHNNQLTGSVPRSFANLTSLSTLYLSGNALTGCFNSSLPQLTTCDVSSTLLECFPPKCTFNSAPTDHPLPIGTPQAEPSSDVILPPGSHENSIIPLAVGISVPISVALIFGVILLVIFMKKKQRKMHNKTALTQRTTKIELASILPEKMIINYDDLKLGKELGAGDFGKVYEGRWHNTQVAVKINVGGDWSNFYNEADLMLNLRPHPNVVQTFGYCEHNNMLVVVLEYCDGGSLDRRLFDDNSALDQWMKIQWMHDIACGVHHLHANNIIHRDLAARNILLSNNTPKISDFGMSRRVEHITEHSQTKSNIGPIRWMAPEALGNRIYNEKSDVWSFGIVCWEILNQTEPHLVEDPLTIAVKIRDQFITPDISNCDERIATILRQCWQSNPQDRPDMKSVCDQLAALL